MQPQNKQGAPNDTGVTDYGKCLETGKRQNPLSNTHRGDRTTLNKAGGSLNTESVWKQGKQQNPLDTESVKKQGKQQNPLDTESA